MIKSLPPRLWHAVLVPLAALLLLGGIAFLIHRVARTGATHRVLLLLEPPAQWNGLTEHQRLGLMVLLKDHLERDAGWVVQETELERRQTSAVMALLRLRAERLGNRLRLRATWTPAGAATQSLDTGFLPPFEAMAKLISTLGWRGQPSRCLATSDPDRYFDLADVTGSYRDADHGPGIKLGEELLRKEPGSASACMALAYLRWGLLVQRSLGDIDAQVNAENLMRKTLALCPDHPRALYWLVRMQVDLARQREAFEILEQAVESRPRIAQLYTGLAYAARTTGLLELAMRAERRRNELVGFVAPHSQQLENSYFYIGDWQTFEAFLDPPGDEVVNSIRDFYRGYARLCQGDPVRARGYFVRSAGQADSFPQFRELAAVYQAHMEGRTEEGLALLRDLRQRRARLRVPDGEYTFKLAEAFAYLGQTEDAVDTAQRAFGQGFGCTRWYEKSPLLAGLQPHPRFQLLLRHLQERQQLLEARFPPKRFGL